MRTFLAALGLSLASAASAVPPLPGPPPPPSPPKLLIVISVDQLSADIFDEYRPHFTGGLARLARGTVFRNGYQAHAATETCPGHSTLLTGMNPAATGIIANSWIDQSVARDDKHVNCAEDERVPGSTSRAYTVSPYHLRVPTLAELMKQRSPASRVVSVGGKDRSALMMSGRGADQRWYWGGKGFVTDLAGAAVPKSVTATNVALATMIAAAQAPLEPPPLCSARAARIQVGQQVMGDGRFERAAADLRAFRASPAFDGATLALTAGLIQELGLGRGQASDLLTIGLAGTDVIGHTFGTGGQEMCLQLLSLDRDLGDFFRLLDSSGIDYAVALSADHGARDMPERLRTRGQADAVRADPKLKASIAGAAIAKQIGVSKPVLLGDETSGDFWLDRSLNAAQRRRALAAAIAYYRAHPQVETVFTAEEIARTPLPRTRPDRFSLLERVRAGFDPQRSGDFYVILKQHVSPIAEPGAGYVAGHGTPWDHDRRVPILFWRPGMEASERPEPVSTTDIMPTLFMMLFPGAPLPQSAGHCIGGFGVSCPASRWL